MKKLFFTNAKYNKLGKAFSKRPTTYKKLAKQIIIAILFTVVTVTSCKENLVNDNSGKTQTQLQEETYPKDIPFEEYLLEGTSCEWTGFEPNTVIIINNNEDLENHINCTADSSPEIDFSKNSLLLVLVTDVAGCNIDSHVEKLLLKQLSANNYELSIEINPSLTANVAPFFKYIAVITEKLDESSAVELNITINQEPLTICNVNNPLTDLPWLKKIVDEFEGDKLSHTRISQCTYKDGVGFLIESCVGCPDFGSTLTNCNGETLCILFGFAGDPCTEFEIDFNSVKVIWERNNNT